MTYLSRKLNQKLEKVSWLFLREYFRRTELSRRTNIRYNLNNLYLMIYISLPERVFIKWMPSCNTLEPASQSV